MNKTPHRLFHRTSKKNAETIIANGFRDGEDRYHTNSHHRGVWLSDRPLDSNEGAWGDTIIAVEFDDPDAIAEFEWIEDEKPYREWLVPADRINGVARMKVIPEDDTVQPLPKT